MQLGFLITTCKSYFQNVEDIINDIEKCVIDKNHVLIVSAQEDDFEDYFYRGVKIIKVPYTALQLTGLVYLYENKKLLNSFNYWFVLPCTIKIGLDFNNKIIKFLNKNKEEDSIPIINPKLLPYRTMDMGILKSSFINIMGEYLMKLKLKSYDDKDFINMYMTSFIQLIINSKTKVKADIINGGWLEFDSQKDLIKYENRVNIF